MTINEYQKAALDNLYIKDEWRGFDKLVRGLKGISEETIECATILNELAAQDEPLDCDRIAEKLGRLAAYLALSADAIYYDLETILHTSILEQKRERYLGGTQ